MATDVCRTKPPDSSRRCDRTIGEKDSRVMPCFDTVQWGSHLKLTLSEPQPRLGDKLTQTNLSPKRDCGSKATISALKLDLALDRLSTAPH